MTSAIVLLTELRQLGADVAVVNGRLRIEAPRGAVTPGLRQALTDHKAELLAILTPGADVGGHLTPADVGELLTDMHASIRAAYSPGALRLLDRDPNLRQRFDATESCIDDLAKVPGGPTEAEFRTALEAHAAVWRELVARYQAHQERHRWNQCGLGKNV